MSEMTEVTVVTAALEMLREENRQLREDRRQLRGELEDANNAACLDPEAHEYHPTEPDPSLELLMVVRTAHDATHDTPWPVCLHPTCRIAWELGQR